MGMRLRIVFMIVIGHCCLPLFAEEQLLLPEATSQ